MPSQNANEKSAKPARRARGQQRVAVLKAAGAAAFAERGYDAATMTEVAEAAKSSIGSLYQFFPTKAALAEAIHQDLITEMAAVFKGLKTTTGQSGAAIAEALLEAFAGFLTGHPEFVILADRRDIAHETKAARGQYLRGEIAGLLAGANPPIAASDLPVMAGLVLEIMKIIVAASQEGGDRGLVADELREMLQRRLS